VVVQRTVRAAASARAMTLFVIAHRLPTVIDYDKILVVDGGRVVEFGNPHELLQRQPASAFAAMVESTGPASAAFLRQAAADAHSRFAL
jgi:ABC-type multidrug transport system fused ATPase/permease subunit